MVRVCTDHSQKQNSYSMVRVRTDHFCFLIKDCFTPLLNPNASVRNNELNCKLTFEFGIRFFNSSYLGFIIAHERFPARIGFGFSASCNFLERMANRNG